MHIFMQFRGLQKIPTANLKMKLSEEISMKCFVMNFCETEYLTLINFKWLFIKRDLK